MQDPALKELSKLRGFGFSWQKFKNKNNQNQKTHTKTNRYGFFCGKIKKKKKKTQPRKQMGREEKKKWSFPKVLFSSVQSLSCVWLFVIPWTAAHQASLSITNSQNLLKLMSIESVMSSSHLILCRPLLLLPSIFPSIRVFSNESVLHIRWLNCWSFSFNISPSNEYPGLISFRMDWLDLLVV